MSRTPTRPGPSADVLRARGRLGHAVAAGRDTTDARRELAEAKITAYVEHVVSQAPPLSDEAVAHVAALLRRPATSTPLPAVVPTSTDGRAAA